MCRGWEWSSSQERCLGAIGICVCTCEFVCMGRLERNVSTGS